jgi:hypothetical protein
MMAPTMLSSFQRGNVVLLISIGKIHCWQGGPYLNTFDLRASNGQPQGPRLRHPGRPLPLRIGCIGTKWHVGQPQGPRLRHPGRPLPLRSQRASSLSQMYWAIPGMFPHSKVHEHNRSLWWGNMTGWMKLLIHIIASAIHYYPFMDVVL